MNQNWIRMERAPLKRLLEMESSASANRESSAIRPPSLIRSCCFLNARGNLDKKKKEKRKPFCSFQKCPWWPALCETSNGHRWLQLERPRSHSSLLAEAKPIDAIMLFSKHNMILSYRASRSLKSLSAGFPSSWIRAA